MNAILLITTLVAASAGNPVAVPIGGDPTFVPPKTDSTEAEAPLPDAPVETTDVVTPAAASGSGSQEDLPQPHSPADATEGVILFLKGGAAPQEKISALSDDQILALVVALLDAESAENRSKAAVELGRVDDHRVVNALAYVARFDDDRSVALLAVEALAAQSSGQAVRTLEMFASSVTSRLRQPSVDLLAGRTDSAAVEALYRLATESSIPRSTRDTARVALQEKQSEMLAVRPLPVDTEADNVGIDRPELMMIAGALFGSYDLMTLGMLGKSGAGPVIGFLGGAAAGGAAGWLFQGSIPTDRLAYGASAMTWGTVTGLAGTYALVRDPSANAALVLGVGGQVLGFGLAYATADKMEFTLGDTAYTNAAGLVGGIMGIGALNLASRSSDPRRGVAVVLGSSLAGLALGAGSAKWIQLTAGDATMVALLGYEGWQTGTWFGELIAQRGLRAQEVFGADVLATGSGLIVGTLMSQWTDYRTSDALHALVLSGYGNSFGSGLAVLVDAKRTLRKSLQITLTWGGFASALTWAQPLQYSTGDATLISVATAVGFWHGIMIAGYLTETRMLDADRASGLMGIIPPIFGVAAIALSQYSAPEPYEILMGWTGAFWGGWFALAGAILADAESLESVLLATLIASDVGLLATTGLVSPLGGLDPNVVAGVNVGGLGGAVIFTLFAALFAPATNPLIVASLIGSGVGFVAGGITMSLIAEEPALVENDSTVAGLFGDWKFAHAGPQPVVGPWGEIEGAVFTVAFVN